MKIDIRLRIEQGLAELVPPESEGEVEAIAAAGALAIPYQAPRFEHSREVAAACVRALLQIGSEVALNALLAYTADDTPAVIEALVLSLREATDKPPTRNAFSRMSKVLRHRQQGSNSCPFFPISPPSRCPACPR